MRLRTLIELLVALILTFAALFAVSEMARTTGMKVNNVYARSTIVEGKTGVYLTLNNVGSEPDRFGCAATDAAHSQPGLIHHIRSHDANPLANWLSTQN